MYFIYPSRIAGFDRPTGPFAIHLRVENIDVDDTLVIDFEESVERVKISN